MDLVEAGGADGQLADDQRCPSVAEHVDASSDRAVVGVPGHSINFLCSAVGATSTDLVLAPGECCRGNAARLSCRGGVCPSWWAQVSRYEGATRVNPGTGLIL